MVSTGINRHAPYTEQTLEREFSPAEIRSFNTVPINIVIPANAKTFLVPMQCTFVGTQGSVAYSAAPSPAWQYSDGTPFNKQIDATGGWDGSATALSVIPDCLDGGGSQAGSATSWISQLGLALQITSSADVTGGDATCKIKLVYRAYDLTGDL